MEIDERGDVEVGQHVAVGDDERVVDAAEVGRESDRPGGVERLGLDRVVQRNPVALAVGKGLDERLGLEAECQRHVGDPSLRQVVDKAFDDRHVPDRQHRFRCRQRQRPQVEYRSRRPERRRASAACGGCRRHRGGRDRRRCRSSRAGCRWSRRCRPSCRPVDVDGAGAVGDRSSWSAITAPPSAAPSVGSCDAQSGCGMSAPFGTNATTNTMPSLVMRMLLKSVTTSWKVPGVGVVIPDPDCQLGVLAVALGVFRRPLVATLVGGHDQLGVGELDVVASRKTPSLARLPDDLVEHGW